MSFDFHDKSIGIGFTGSFCTYEKIFSALEELKKTGASLLPVFSLNASQLNSRFGTSSSFLERARELTGKEPITTIPGAEPIGPKGLMDILVIAPCTGNTLSKLANGISDTPVLMAANSHLRNHRPLVLSLSTHAALGMNLKNIGILLNTKNIYFVPFGQDDYRAKPNSMTAFTELLPETIDCALSGKQIQPVIQSPHGAIA